MKTMCENHVLSWLSSKCHCDNSFTLAHGIRLHIAGTNTLLNKQGKEPNTIDHK